jgi:hypothetical protein
MMEEAWYRHVINNKLHLVFVIEEMFKLKVVNSSLGS